MTMAEIFTSLSAWQVMAWGLAFFGGIYLLFGGITFLPTRKIPPWLGWDRPLDNRPVTREQRRAEFTQSGISIPMHPSIRYWSTTGIRW